MPDIPSEPTVWRSFPPAARGLRRNRFRAAAVVTKSAMGTALESIMLKWALIFFIISLVAGFLGFSGVSAAAAGIAKILFGIFVAIFLILLVLGLLAGEALF
jgi:uncharacterized membrane protein YtjA (UPF0391 family)